MKTFSPYTYLLNYQNKNLLLAAEFYAMAAHAAVNQKRKYTGEPYINHPRRVVDILEQHMVDLPVTESVLATAWLHDVIEDTGVDAVDLEAAFGTEICQLVLGCSSITTSSPENRAARKELDKIWYSSGDYRVQSVKVADSIDNMQDIAKNDPGFAVVFLKEKFALVEALTKADANLRYCAFQLIEVLQKGLEDERSECSAG